VSGISSVVDTIQNDLIIVYAGNFKGEIIMSKNLRISFKLLSVIIGIVILTSCVYQNGQVIIRIPFAELQSGGYYGGNLIYHPNDPLISHI